MYDRVARAVRNVPGQEAEVRFLQGDGFRDREMYQEAMNAYLLPTKYRNLDGPWTVEAVNRIPQLLNTTGKCSISPICSQISSVGSRGRARRVVRARCSVWAQVGGAVPSLAGPERPNQRSPERAKALDTIVRVVP